MKLSVSIFCLSLICVIYSCQSNEPLKGELGYAVIPVEIPDSAHFRGLQTISDEVVWLSGTEGTVMLTTNGGKSWNDVTVPECESLDFRDIHALDKKRAWVMSSGNGARIYYTENAGKDWTLQFEDKNQKVFLDGMDFKDALNGVAFGDPLGDYMSPTAMDVLTTSDGGLNWNRIPVESLPTAWEDEAGFAASGTGVVYKENTIWIATGGGEISRILKSEDKGATWNAYKTPIKGGSGQGVFSMAMKDKMNGVVVGGDYVDSTRVKYNCAVTADGGITWELIEENGPLGYRSCVAITNSGTAIACGRTGIDKSSDFKTWSSISTEGYFTCDAAETYVWLAGRRGKVAKMRVE
ncbi:MAG: WD40/YVTN/BNR-like repeat-containing protein [Flavobacteriales bacterium]